MQLKSLTMTGFKSFAEKTEIRFEPGFTALVGPNGCGKSNVLDAMKWVLGEKSAKSIRGEKMEDVIFSGTENVKPVSMSEVKMVFENKDGVLPISSSEVSICRRLFRDGESIFLINNKQVRLKEIEHLFLDTGIGKHAYSVMEQGKIDQIISTKPEERRYIFEEAAGISKYKQQKRDSIKKLEETNNNLNRVYDVIKEIDRERKIKEKQAEMTKKYQEKRKEFSDYEIRLFALKIAAMSEKLQRVTNKSKLLREKREELAAKVASVNSTIEQKDFARQSVQVDIFEQDKKLLSYQHSINSLENRLETNKKIIKAEKERSIQTNEKLTIRNKGIVELNKKITDFSKQEKDLDKAIAENESSLATIKKRLLEFKKKLQCNLEGIIKNSSQIKDCDNKSAALQEELKKVIGKLVIVLEERKRELEGTEKNRLKHREKIYEIIAKLQNLYSQIMIMLSDENIVMEEIRTIMAEFDLNTLKDEIRAFESFEDGFRTIFFAKEGVHHDKETIQQSIETLIQRKNSLEIDNKKLENEIIQIREDIESNQKEIKKYEIEISKNHNEQSWLKRQKSEYLEQLKDINAQIQVYETELNKMEKNIIQLEKENKEFDKEIINFVELEKKVKTYLQDLVSKRESLNSEINTLKKKITKENEELQNVLPELQRLERDELEAKLKLEQYEEILYTQYELSFAEAKTRNLELAGKDMQTIAKKVNDIKLSMNNLGVINHLAIEEFNDLTERYGFYSKQVKDLETAKQDIYKIIGDIDVVSIRMFMDAFSNIKASFSEIFKKLFNGGSADIILLDMENPIDCGIDIIVNPPGKRPKHISLLSGGEKSMVAIALLFAVYESKPSPFCFLDEIDAALDEANVDRFTNLLRHFADKSQFIVISHNKKTMSMAQTIYGVTMEEAGVSKLVSMRLEQFDQNKEHPYQN